jgi:catechol 2,3-dioxygenase-like lactoylglutathione lyase family enzyme
MAVLDAIGIVSRDIAESCRFYRTLGVVVAEPPDGENHFEAVLPSGLRMMWDTEELIKQLDPEWIRQEGGQGTTLSFKCKDAAEVNETYARLTEAGFTGKTEPYDAFWGQRYADVVDPDGNVVHLFAQL